MTKLEQATALLKADLWLEEVERHLAKRLSPHSLVLCEVTAARAAVRVVLAEMAGRPDELAAARSAWAARPLG